MLVSAAANPLSGRLLKPSESKMEGICKCGFTAIVYTLPTSCRPTGGWCRRQPPIAPASKMEGWFKCGFTAFVATLLTSCNSKSDLGR